MTVVWRDWRDGVAYEVREYEGTKRLYANEVQHSEFNAERLVTGSVWDLLWLPAFMAKPNSIQRVLVLGLGGGSLIPPICHFLDPRDIVAVELDPVHLEVARDQFGVADFGVETHLADAAEWVDNYTGPPFDLVIEDLFAPANRAVTRAIPAKMKWFNKLSKLVTPNGVLVMNFGDEPELKNSDVSKRVKGWASAIRFATPDCHNAVVGWSRQSASSNSVRKRVMQWQELAFEAEYGQLRYTTKQLF